MIIMQNPNCVEHRTLYTRRKQMGRPINKHKLQHIVASYKLGEVAGTAAILKQTGTKKFRLVGVDGVFTLVPVAAADLQSGQMSISALDAAGNTLYAAKLTQHRITDAEGAVHAWSLAAPMGNVVQLANDVI